MHLPVQSGSDKILKAMNRRHTAEYYRDTVSDLRAARADIALSSDFIVGFPGESDADFAATIDLVETVGFASAFSFIYSPRPGTPAADMEGQVTDAVKSERLQRLQQAIERHRGAFNAKCLGRNLDVLFEKPGRLPGQVAGRSPYLQPVQVMASTSLIGEVRTVSIAEVGRNSLFGSLAVQTADMRAIPIALQPGE